MRFFLDTEFNEFGGDLISLALTPQHFKEPDFYEVLRCPKPRFWVKKNVMPVLNKKPIAIREFRTRLAAFLKNAQWKHGDIEIVANWPDDIRYFCQALITGPGKMLSVPNLKFTLDTTLSSETSMILHNALCDAKAIRACWIVRNHLKKKAA